MALLALWIRLPRFFAQQRDATWQSIFTTPIAGRLCVVIGYGDLGQAAARAGKKLGLTVVAVTRSGTGSGPADSVLPASRVEEVLPKADFLIVAAPLTQKTRNFVNRLRLAMLPRSAGVINVARAPIVDYVALAEMLRNGELSGAFLDVHEPEPLPGGSELWSTPNLVVTPHISCDDPRYVEMLFDAWASNLLRLDANRTLMNVVDRTRGY